MILVTRLNGPMFALNPDLVERADQTPDTVVTLVDGTKYVISESVTELIDLIRTYQASVIARSHLIVEDTARSDPAAESGAGPAAAEGTNVVAMHRREH